MRAGFLLTYLLVAASMVHGGEDEHCDGALYDIGLAGSLEECVDRCSGLCEQGCHAINYYPTSRYCLLMEYCVEFIDCVVDFGSECESVEDICLPVFPTVPPTTQVPETEEPETEEPETEEPETEEPETEEPEAEEPETD